MKRFLAVVVVLTAAAGALVVWSCPYTFFGPSAQHLEARRFCESIAPKLEAFRRSHGRYPESIPADWVSNVTIPHLVQIDRFYLPAEDHYLLRFRDSFACAGEDVWGYHGEEPPYNGRWVNYDGY